VNKITTILSNEQRTRIKVVRLEKICNFVIGNFFDLNQFTNASRSHLEIAPGNHFCMQVMHPLPKMISKCG
jgi:hypothetical protein